MGFTRSEKARLLRVMGGTRYGVFEQDGVLVFRSSRYRGRVYVLTGNGTIRFWDVYQSHPPSDIHRWHYICIHAGTGAEGIDEFVDKYLLLTTDEDYILTVGNQRDRGNTMLHVSLPGRYRDEALARKRDGVAPSGCEWLPNLGMAFPSAPRRRSLWEQFLALWHDEGGVAE